MMTDTLSNKFKLLSILMLIIGYLSFSSLAVAHDNHSHLPAVTHLTAIEAKALLATRPDLQVLDVRTKGEYNRGHIDGAIRNNYFSLKFKKRLRQLDRNTAYLVHCKSGHRSNGAVKVMQREGFQDIYHLDGGYDAWKKLAP